MQKVLVYYWARKLMLYLRLSEVQLLSIDVPVRSRFQPFEVRPQRNAVLAECRGIRAHVAVYSTLHINDPLAVWLERVYKASSSAGAVRRFARREFEGDVQQEQ
jgi:hypothetical protein